MKKWNIGKLSLKCDESTSKSKDGTKLCLREWNQIFTALANQLSSVETAELTLCKWTMENSWYVYPGMDPVSFDVMLLEMDIHWHPTKQTEYQNFQFMGI